jgi:predicted  nucleic acid-binding Zn-ribbon protein
VSTQAPQRDAGKKVASLRLVHRREAGPLFDPIALKPGVMFVGRTQNNDIPLPSDNVSRRHAKLIFTDMGLTVHDLDSHNGVFLNGKKVRSTPVKEGDFLYFADICCKVEPADEASDAFSVESSMNKSNLVSQVLQGEEADDPAVRNLATLIQATDLLLSSDDEAFYPEMLSRCRDLTEATLAVLVREANDGTRTTPVVLREGTAPRGAAPVSWPVVNKAMDEGVVLFSRDTAADPLVGPEEAASGEIGALMCVPVIIAGRAKAAVYLGRPFADEGFTDREVETVSALAHLVGVRLQGVRPPGEHTQVAKKGDMSTAEESETIARLEAQHDALTKQVAALQGDTSTLQSAKAELEARIHGMQAENQRLSGEVTRLSHEASERAGSESANSQRVEELEARIEAQLAEIAAARNDSSAAREELSKAQRDGQRATEEAQRAAGEYSRLQAELSDVRERLMANERELDAARDKLSQQAAGVAPEALAQSVGFLPARVRHRVMATAQGQPAPDAFGAGLTTMLCVGLAGQEGVSGFDAWAEQVGPAESRARLDAFMEIARGAAREHDGAVEQSCGHALLISFPGDGMGASSAVACARAILGQVPAGGEVTVKAGLHLALGAMGFFGAEHPAYAQFGPAVAISRAACDNARPGVVYLSAAVKEALPEHDQAQLVYVGRHLINSFRDPVEFFQVGA